MASAEAELEITRILFALRQAMGLDAWPSTEVRDRVEAWVRVNCITRETSRYIYQQGRKAGVAAEAAKHRTPKKRGPKPKPKG